MPRKATGLMTLKKIGCDARKAVKEQATVYLCRVFGEVEGFKPKEGKTGDAYLILKGAFRAVRQNAQLNLLEASEPVVYDSEALSLPGGMEEKICSLWMQHGKPVQFAYDISAVPDPELPTGYYYQAVALIAPRLADHIKALAAALAPIATPEQAPPPSEPEPSGFAIPPDDPPPVAVVDNGKLLVGKPAKKSHKKRPK